MIPLARFLRPASQYALPLSVAERSTPKETPMTTDEISPDLKTVLRRLKLARMLDTLPERLVSRASRRCRTRISCCSS